MRCALSAFTLAVAAFGLSTPVLAQEATPELLSSVTLRSTLDIRMMPGESDALGDHKRVETVYRDQGYVYGVRGGIDTPQKDKAGTQYDTGTFRVTVGREFTDWAIYGSVGATNGAVLEKAQDVVAGMHALFGHSGSRRSPPSSGLKPTVELAMRRDIIVQPSDCDSWCLGATFTPFATLGNTDMQVGMAAFAVVPFSGRIARPDLPQLPALAVVSSYLRLGLVGAGIAYRAETAAVRTAKFQAMAIAGFGIDYQGWGFAADAYVPLLPEVEGVHSRPVPVLTARLAHRF